MLILGSRLPTLCDVPDAHCWRAGGRGVVAPWHRSARWWLIAAALSNVGSLTILWSFTRAKRPTTPCRVRVEWRRHEARCTAACGRLAPHGSRMSQLHREVGSRKASGSERTAWGHECRQQQTLDRDAPSHAAKRRADRSPRGRFYVSQLMYANPPSPSESWRQWETVHHKIERVLRA
jgi:hypothetical protein